MKNLFTLFAIVISAIFMAQAPNLLSYQAVVRNAANQLVINQNVGVKFSILKSSATGAVVYAETQNSTTNSNGLFTTNIGSGTVISGSMASINWANDVYFIKSEIDLAGGSNYTITGTQQLLSVPYALNAKNGIPNGGTANQVLAKVNGTDFNTAWVTPSAGAKLELMAIKNTTQALVLSTSSSPNQITYENVVTAPTLGTYDNNAYTVGSNGAGVYLIQTRNSMIDNASNVNNTVGAYNFLEINGSAYGSLTNIYPSYISNVSLRSTTNSAIRSSSQYMFLVFLNAGDVIRIRATGTNSSVSQTLSNDGGTQLMIVKL